MPAWQHADLPPPLQSAMHPALIPVALAIAWGLNWPAVKIMLSVLTPFNP